jgi:hypothetical protein
VAKFDITQNVKYIDELLAVTENPLQRRILENYRNHNLLEVGGDAYGCVYNEGMMIDVPEYVISWAGLFFTIKGKDEIYNQLYKPLVEERANVLCTIEEDIILSDKGFASEMLVRQYGTGKLFADQTADVLDPDGLYTREIRGLTIFPYDAEGRLIGERAAQFLPGGDITECPPDEFITPEETAEKLLPLARPLEVGPVAV